MIDRHHLFTQTLRAIASCVLLLALGNSVVAEGGGMEATMSLDQVTRYMHITYSVPANAPDTVSVTCSWSRSGENDWRLAAVAPLLSETALPLVPDADKAEWAQGKVIERRAAGLRRTVIFDPYPEAQLNGRVDADFRIDIRKPSGGLLSSQIVHLQADNTDVVYITDWSKVLQNGLITTSPVDGKWLLSRDSSGGQVLSCRAGAPLPALTYPLSLKGPYAIFVSTDPSIGSIRLRLSGDERAEKVASSGHDKESLWRWARLDHQHLILKQGHYFTGYTDSSVRYVKLVPLSKKTADALDARYEGRHDKFVAAYYEPYSWAFYQNITEPYQHREPLTAYAEAGVDLLDVSCGRFGSRFVYETRTGDQLIYSTEGDPIDGKIPETDNVGRMQQYTNMLGTQMKYARELGLDMHAQFGATACYPDSALESQFSKKHPNWRRSSSLLFSVPEVQDYILSVYREVLEMGAPGISIDFCRYPDGVDSADDCNKLMRRLRKLADEIGKARGKHVTILIRFPATGVRQWKHFDYRTWAREGLVDYLCPSNLQCQGQYFDIRPYLNAVKGTKTRLTPVIDALEWGPVIPGQFLWRAKQIYDSGADGVYIYQSDSAIYSPSFRNVLHLLRSREAVTAWLRHDEAQRKYCSKGIFITPPSDGKAYHFWERLRIWVDGLTVREMQTYIDGKLVGKLTRQPFILGTDGHDSDNVIPAGEHKLLVRVRDGGGWLEQQFAIKGK